MKSFRVTKSKEQIEEQRKVEEHSLKELSEFFNLLISAKQEEQPITEEQIVEHSEIIETITVPVEEEPLIVSLQEGHYFELMWAVDSTTVSLMSPAATSFCPSTPYVVIAATQVNL